MSLIRNAAKTFVRSLGYDIRQTGLHIYKRPIDFIRSRNIDLVVDVGANTGQYPERLRSDGYEGWIVSFEPVRATYEVLAARASRDRCWTALNMALGQNEETAEINVSESSDLSSFLPQLPAAATFSPGARVIRGEPVRVARLDDVFRELPQSRATFLKIDTQGYL